MQNTWEGRITLNSWQVLGAPTLAPHQSKKSSFYDPSWKILEIGIRKLREKG